MAAWYTRMGACRGLGETLGRCLHGPTVPSCRDTHGNAPAVKSPPWHMNPGMTRWKVEPLKCRGLPERPVPFSPAGWEAGSILVIEWHNDDLTGGSPPPDETLG